LFLAILQIQELSGKDSAISWQRIFIAVKRVYRIVTSKLNAMAIEGRTFSVRVQRYGMDNIDTNENYQNLEFLNSSESAVTRDSMYRSMQGKQLEAVDNILHAVNDPIYVGKKCFSIDGPGGTGKTFV